MWLAAEADSPVEVRYFGALASPTLYLYE